MPNLGELASRLVGLLTGAIDSTSIRLGAAPTVAILLVLLIFLSLLARPGSRWSRSDLGRLSAIGHAMALAAESGADAAISLGAAGVARSASAIDRFATLASLPLLGHVAQAAARSGVPLLVTTNDPVAALLAQGTLEDAHRRTATPERASASEVEYLGEGRPVAAAAALSQADSHGVAMVAGGSAEEALMVLDGLRGDADWSVAALASASQAAGPLLDWDGAMIGPELYQAAGGVAVGGHGRAMVLAANRLIWSAIVVLIVGSIVDWAGGPQLAGFLTGR